MLQVAEADTQLIGNATRGKLSVTITHEQLGGGLDDVLDTLHAFFFTGAGRSVEQSLAPCGFTQHRVMLQKRVFH
ncbi:hypothetical protein D3C72_1922200 [compost metagenome]